MSSSSASTHSEYETWVRKLYQTNMFHPVKMGLQNIEQLHEALGYPMDNKTVIHIAGTNGKGSVAWKMASSLQTSGLKVGLFCSPHVSSFRERMQINKQLISEEQVVELLPQIYKHCDTLDIPATFFEITTALAFSFFQQADVVVLETGLGGRLDATNVVKKPAISVITSIDLEHTRILGDTKELIAIEKAGIIKKDAPVLVGPNVPLEVLKQCAKEKQAGRFCELKDVIDYQETDDYDVENAQIAEAALKIVQEAHPEFHSIDTSPCYTERPPCRFEEIQYQGRTVLLDVAHNPPAIDYLLKKLHKNYPNQPLRFVIGMSSDKDLQMCSDILTKSADRSNIHLVQAAHPRAAKLEDIVKVMPGAHYDLEDRSVSRQLVSALQYPELIVICGSVFLMSEARQALDIDEPRDSAYIAEVAGAGVKASQENFGRQV